MAYNELIKNFERIRDYMREFYVYGFKSRDEYDQKSARSYDDKRRCIESWLGDYMSFRQRPDGKNVFISIDSRVSHHNPLYRAWKACSFTDGDITLHFIIFDILHSPEVALSAGQITERIDSAYLSTFTAPKVFDESTVRKKLKEYVAEGLLLAHKRGKTVLYSRTPEDYAVDGDVLAFYSEVAPCGVIGSFLLDKQDARNVHFAFKHHYITQALDSEILCRLFVAMKEKREVAIKSLNRRSDKPSALQVIPLRVFISVQNGRQYLLAYQRSSRRIRSYRLDYILSVCFLEPADDYDNLREKLDHMQAHMWGVSTQGRGGRTEHIAFTVHYSAGEEYIYQRLTREKRCGNVEKLDEHTCRFSAEVYDTNEMVPWIRTFICRITDINFSNKTIERQFKQDIHAMYRLYGLDRGAVE